MKFKDYTPTGFVCWDNLMPKCPNAHFTGTLSSVHGLGKPTTVVSGGYIEITTATFDALMNANVTHWFAQNATHVDPRLSPMPIFLPDKSHFGGAYSPSASFTDRASRVAWH